MTPETRKNLEKHIRTVDARAAACHRRAREWMTWRNGYCTRFAAEEQKKGAALKDEAMALRFMLIDQDSKPIVFTEYEISRLRTFAWNQNHQPEMRVLSAKLDLMVPDARRDEWRQFNQGWEDYSDEPTATDTPAG